MPFLREEWLVFVVGGGSRSPGRKEGRGILYFLGNVDGYFGGWQGCCSLSLVVVIRPFCFSTTFLVSWSSVHSFS